MIKDIFSAKIKFPGCGTVCPHQLFVYKREGKYVEFYSITSMSDRERYWAGEPHIFVIMGADKDDNGFKQNCYVRFDRAFKVKLSGRVDIDKINTRYISPQLRQSIMKEIEDYRSKYSFVTQEIPTGYFLKLNKGYIKREEIERKE